MGGCRCTYRNCTVKSDGQVHMFHYPVFEKLRCHKWLLNAHRLDFLDLRVSQLKNRVVCQHHFKDVNFMNYKKDKLKFDAIPTEDGPYCDKSEQSSQPVDINKLYLIIPEDIENTYCAAYDKKTNYSLRYGDFLTNSEPSDLHYLDMNNKSDFDNDNPSLNLRKDVRKNVVLKDEPICIEINNLSSNTSLVKTNSLLNIEPQNMINSKIKIPVRGGKGNRSKVNIISEKKIRHPIPIKGKFKKVSPSLTLPTPKNRSLSILPEKVENLEAKSNTTNVNFDKSYVVQVEYDPSQTIQNQMVLNNTPQSVNEESSIVQYPLNDVNIIPDDNKLQIRFSEATPNTGVSEIPATPQSKQLLPKVKFSPLTPERKAVIDSKREFNKMLRNVIHACLDTNYSVGTNEDVNTNKHSANNSSRIKEIKKQLCLELEDTKKENQIKNRQKQTRINPVGQSQSILKPVLKKPNVPVEADDKNSLLSFLEARMQILESNVICRIDQNTKQISDLKEQFAKGPSKNCSTQTYENVEGYKKFLYQEISKFLSPSCNSSIYEELFINKYSVNEETAQPRAKRRR